jgi:hypothetical protein
VLTEGSYEAEVVEEIGVLLDDAKSLSIYYQVEDLGVIMIVVMCVGVIV